MRLTLDGQRKLIEQLRGTQKQIDWCATSILASGNDSRDVGDLALACDAIEDAIDLVCAASIVGTMEMAQQLKVGAQ